MFDEYKCGCIISVFQGRVRICEVHRTPHADGYGGAGFAVVRGIIRQYPANGEMPRGWSGK